TFVAKQVRGQFDLAGNGTCSHERRGCPLLSSDLQSARPQCPCSPVTQNKNQQIGTVSRNTTPVECNECRLTPAVRSLTASSHATSIDIRRFLCDRWNHNDAL